MLIILSGLPGVGKTTIARELARRLDAVHVRIDTPRELEYYQHGGILQYVLRQLL